MKKVIPLAVALLLTLTGQAQDQGSGKKSAEKSKPTAAQYEARIERLEVDLAACKSTSEALKKAAQLGVDAVGIAQDRDRAEEEVRRLQKQLTTALNDLSKATGGRAGAAAPQETIELDAYKKLQGSLTEVQTNLTESQGRAQKLAAEKTALAESLAKANEEITGLRETVQARDLSIAGLKADVSQRDRHIQEQNEGFEAFTKVHQGVLANLGQTKQALETRTGELRAMTGERDRFQAIVENRLEGALVHLTDAIVPAQPLNLRNTVPDKKEGLVNKYRGIIVVNCWVDASGHVKAVRMIQPLPGLSWEVKEINRAYLEAAKRLVFTPATSADGKTRYQVWQGVGFFVDE